MLSDKRICAKGCAEGRKNEKRKPEKITGGYDECGDGDVNGRVRFV